jgi:hypothetical protein
MSVHIRVALVQQPSRQLVNGQAARGRRPGDGAEGWRDAGAGDGDGDGDGDTAPPRALRKKTRKKTETHSTYIAPRTTAPD